MTPGYYVAGACKPEADALQLLAAITPPSVWESGGVIWWQGYTGEFDASGQPVWARISDWHGSSETVVTTGFGLSGAVACDVEQPVADGIALGWLVASVLVGAFAGRLLRRAL
jgi:hypothetical protein